MNIKLNELKELKDSAQAMLQKWINEKEIANEKKLKHQQLLQLVADPKQYQNLAGASASCMLVSENICRHLRNY